MKSIKNIFLNTLIVGAIALGSTSCKKEEKAPQDFTIDAIVDYTEQGKTPITRTVKVHDNPSKYLLVHGTGEKQIEYTDKEGGMFLNQGYLEREFLPQMREQNKKTQETQLAYFHELRNNNIVYVHLQKPNEAWFAEHLVPIPEGSDTLRELYKKQSKVQ